jgi:hypothetical protein
MALYKIRDACLVTVLLAVGTILVLATIIHASNFYHESHGRWEAKKTKATRDYATYCGPNMDASSDIVFFCKDREPLLRMSVAKQALDETFSHLLEDVNPFSYGWCTANTVCHYWGWRSVEFVFNFTGLLWVLLIFVVLLMYLAYKNKVVFAVSSAQGGVMTGGFGVGGGGEGRKTV